MEICRLLLGNPLGLVEGKGLEVSLNLLLAVVIATQILGNEEGV
jgi:hypothetical protein